MLSYQHGYHAGNFADVVKHLTLCRIVNYMIQKEKPLFYLETHAGSGIYDLNDKKAQKTTEFNTGIAHLWEQRNKLLPLFDPYIKVIKSMNLDNNLRYYPGSPYLAIASLRPQDRLICTELHPQEFKQLAQLPRLKKRVFFSHMDGIQAMHSLLPPAERRGLIFIDPAYEVKTEYKDIAKAVNAAYHKFATGVYCIWYPILDNRLHTQLVRKIKEDGLKQVLRIEFLLSNTNQDGMTGCGLLIINPPFKLAEEITTILDYLVTVINPGKSFYFIE
ncbi:protein involved in catabolism of external DNA [Legionella beliardensis]|uniref:Ribosomal RNA large subunit methyltransferase J n=1 Tax=Legionella beliardensis TaxID=91822 RepID=A0A378I240_9GAMM|nr:23S rRNA (adenine(2030)-N(6))-methyltransferase RlmJ [Legionella beliardensis]STX29063.1 protein involved in catabolism of external DNA [Legionella beliardensis]